MVSVLPAKVSPWQSIGQAMTNLGKSAPQLMENRYQRGQLQGALDEIKNLGTQEDLNPLELMTSIMKAGAGIPGSEKYLAQLYPMVSQQLQSKMMPKGPGGEQQAPEGDNQVSASQGAAPKQEAQEQLPMQLPTPTSEPYGDVLEGIELGRGPIPKTYSPEQYDSVTRQYKSSGLDPAPAIRSMQIHDQAARAEIDDMIKGAKTVGDINTLRAQQQERVRTKLREQLPELNPQDFAIAERISLRPEFRDIKNDALRAQKVKQEYDRYQKAATDFNKVAERSNYNEPEYNRQVDQLGNYAKTLVENGQRDLAEQILKNNAWGPVETARILNPLSQQYKNSFEKLPEVKSVLDRINVSPEDPRFDEIANRALKSRQNELDKYKDVIKKDFKTGSYDAASNVVPGTSLLLLRDQVLGKNVEWQEFEKMINEMVNSGQLKLDSYQRSELPLLGQHPDKSFGLNEIIWRLNPFYKGRR